MLSQSTYSFDQPTPFMAIMTIRSNGHIEKRIPWSAFTLTERDWERIANVRDILKVTVSFVVDNEQLIMWWQDSNDIQELFSSEQQPTLWCALSALEELQTTWEDKWNLEHFLLYKDAINTGLAKLEKYYSWIDTKPVFILALGMYHLFLQVFSIYAMNYSSPPVLQTRLY